MFVFFCPSHILKSYKYNICYKSLWILWISFMKIIILIILCCICAVFIGLSIMEYSLAGDWREYVSKRSGINKNISMEADIDQNRLFQIFNIDCILNYDMCDHIVFIMLTLKYYFFFLYNSIYSFIFFFVRLVCINFILDLGVFCDYIYFYKLILLNIIYFFNITSLLIFFLLFRQFVILCNYIHFCH